jgi:molybdopterin-guanine dinucleotide biosynthesis protein A
VDWVGAVLAGGESRRFGSDKALALIEGIPLVERAAATLARAFPEVVIVSSRAPTTTAWRHVADERAGQGPLAGIEAALRHAADHGFQGAFVLACDLPLVDSATVAAVASALGDHAAAAPAGPGDRRWEPLCAVYRVECLPLVSAALDRGERAAHAVLEAVGAVRVELPNESFLNVNTPGDHVRATEVLEGGAA